MATNLEDRLVGKLFDGRYRIERKLGSGGMAEVYLAEDEELGRKVALKILNERHARDEQFVERFKREARNAASLSHPHIVRIYDRGQFDETYYIAMEYLDGPTLKELLVRKGPTPPLTAIKFAREILSALAEAHRHDIVHRDIKPHNVIVSPDWNVKVTDFGIARSGASQMTEAGSIVGTAQYLSPEQARGKPVDQRSDLYSVGIVLYEMLTGTVPFTGDAAVEIAMKHLSNIPEPPSTRREGISPDLDAVVMRALAKDPEQRYASADEMDADLARVARGVAVSQQTSETMTQVLADAEATSIVPRAAATPPPAPPAYRPPSYYEEAGRRRSPWPMILGIVAIGIIAFGGYLIYNKVTKAINTNAPVAVQNVEQLPVKNAETLLHAQGLQTHTVGAPSSTIAATLVISQNPSPGDRVVKDTIVTLTVSTGVPKTTVPALVNLPLGQAETTLENEGLHWSDPQRQLEHGRSGLRDRVVPAEGAARARRNHRPAERLDRAEDRRRPVGRRRAVRERPERPSGRGLQGHPLGRRECRPGRSGRRAEPGRRVVGLARFDDHALGLDGPAGVRRPVGHRRRPDHATQLLQTAGFTVPVVQQDVTDPQQDGIVLNQSPASGTKLKQGAAVTITVGHLVTAPPANTTTASTSTTATTTPVTPTTATTTTPTTAVTTTPTSPPSQIAP